MKQHQITLEEICEGVYQAENMIAASSSDSKRLETRVSISLLGKTSVRFLVKDTSKPINHQIVLITDDVKQAIERYNSL